MLTVAKVVAYFSLQINLECGKGRWEVNYPLARRSSTEVQVIPPAAYAIITGICHSQATVHPAPIPTCWNGLFLKMTHPTHNHKSLHSHSCCLQGPHSTWKLSKGSGHSRTRLSPYHTEHAFLHSYKPAQTSFTAHDATTTASSCLPYLTSQSPATPRQGSSQHIPSPSLRRLPQPEGPLFIGLQTCSKYSSL